MRSEPAVSNATTHAYLRALIALLAFVTIMTAKMWIVQWLVLGGVTATALILDLMFVFAVFAAVDLAFADLRLRALLVSDAIVSTLLMALIVYNAYYGLLPSRQSLSMVGQAMTVGGGIVTLVSPLYLLLFIDIPLIALWITRSRRHGKDPLTGRPPGAPIAHGLRTPYVYQRRSVYGIALAVSLVLAYSVRATASTPDARDTIAVASSRGVGSYLAVALMNPNASSPSLAQASGAEASDFQARIDELAGHTEGEPLAGFEPGQAKGKNVIIIQVEALQSIAVGKTVEKEAVTPNLDALIAESWYFPNCVSGAGVGTTADVEFVTNTSLYPPPEVGASLGWSDRQLTSLPRLLDTYGYDSATFHTNEVNFWNRGQFYPAVGFTRYFDRSYFGTEDQMAFESASDRVLFEKTLPLLKEAKQARRPFYAQIIMMSSHFPFENVPSDQRKLRPGAPYDGTIVGNYLTEVHYVDEQIGYFVSELKRTGLWDDSIVVVYGDHFGLPEPRSGSEAKALRALGGHDYNDADKALVPLIVHLPGQEKGTRIARPVGQVDLAPTLADALDVDLSGMAHFGRSILRSSGGVMAAGGLLGRGAYVDDSVLYIPGAEFERGRVYDIRTREELTISEASETTWNNVRELIGLSREYVASLPLREDFDSDADVSFPSKE